MRWREKRPLILYCLALLNKLRTTGYRRMGSGGTGMSSQQDLSLLNTTNLKVVCASVMWGVGVCCSNRKKGK
jgi:hypothetical protein